MESGKKHTFAKKGSTWTILNTRRFRDLDERGLVTEAGWKAFREAGKKEFVDERDLLKILRQLDGLGIRYWVDGGWGVDILAGRRTRRHRDLDIDYDGRETGTILSSLKDAGFVVETDSMPVRMELHHQELGYLDIHPFELFPDGSARQADGKGGWFEFTPVTSCARKISTTLKSCLLWTESFHHHLFILISDGI